MPFGFNDLFNVCCSVSCACICVFNVLNVFECLSMVLWRWTKVKGSVVLYTSCPQSRIHWIMSDIPQCLLIYGWNINLFLSCRCNHWSQLVNVERHASNKGLFLMNTWWNLLVSVAKQNYFKTTISAIIYMNNES